jgi:hypothetical protein
MALDSVNLQRTKHKIKVRCEGNGSVKHPDSSIGVLPHEERGVRRMPAGSKRAFSIRGRSPPPDNSINIICLDEYKVAVQAVRIATNETSDHIFDYRVISENIVTVKNSDNFARRKPHAFVHRIIDTMIGFAHHLRYTRSVLGDYLQRIIRRFSVNDQILYVRVRLF